MARWPVDPRFEDITTINNGEEFDENDPFVAGIMNQLVRALIYLYKEGVHDE